MQTKGKFDRRKRYQVFLPLMFISMVVITGFQAYWLKDNYDREKRILDIRSNSDFQETVRQLQAAKLRLKDFPDFDTSRPDRGARAIVGGVHRPHEVPGQKIVDMVNAIRRSVMDSLRKAGIDPGFIPMKDLALRKKDPVYKKPANTEETNAVTHPNENFFKFLYGVDSLQDTLTVPEITNAYKQRLDRDKIVVPFQIVQLRQAQDSSAPEFGDATVGLAHPVTYHLQLGNSLPYLLQRLTFPLLFSIFLVGLTIFSFVLLYRNLVREQRLAALKNEFISNITHELKTPIATVGVAIEALRNFNALQDPKRSREYLDISSNELQRLSLLVDKVLKLSMFEKKEIELRYETVDLADVVNEVLTSMRLQLEKFKVATAVRHEGDTTLEGDRLHLLSVVFNLLDNSMKYSPTDPAIEIRMKGEQGHVQLDVIDNGVGIPAGYKNRIFEKFFRVPSGDTHNAKGYGLGLSYVAHVIKQHHGEISVESELGKGTTITIILPKRQA